MRKRRYRTGTLSQDQVKEILERYDRGDQIADIASDLNVTVSTVYYRLKNKGGVYFGDIAKNRRANRK